MIAVHDQVVPLVEDGDSPVAVGNVGECEVSRRQSHLVKAKSAPSGLPRLT